MTREYFARDSNIDNNKKFYKMKKIILTPLLSFIMAFLSILSVNAQNPVKWSATTDMKSDTEGIITITGNIEHGWHIYGSQMPEDGPNPTQIFFKQKGIEYIGNVKVSPSPKKEMDSMFGCELTYWENKVVFKRKFKVTDPSDAEITVTISYMGCNDSNCIPPRKENITVKVNK